MATATVQGPLPMAAALAQVPGRRRARSVQCTVNRVHRDWRCSPETATLGTRFRILGGSTQPRVITPAGNRRPGPPKQGQRVRFTLIRP